MQQGTWSKSFLNATSGNFTLDIAQILQLARSYEMNNSLTSQSKISLVLSINANETSLATFDIGAVNLNTPQGDYVQFTSMSYDNKGISG